MSECISDCATNNEPALRNNDCDCAAVKLMDKIEAYPFESKGGDLKNCVDWEELKKEVRNLRFKLFEVQNVGFDNE